jgi:hypothetical protein
MTGFRLLARYRCRDTSGERCRADSPIGRAAPPKGDDVLRVLAFRRQPSVQRKGEVLIQENLQDAWRTAGGTCAATWAAYARAARTCSTDS